MAFYGNFETVRRVDSGSSQSVFTARQKNQSGQLGPETAAIKIFSPPEQVLGLDLGESGDPWPRISADAKSSIACQKAAAAVCENVAPVLEQGESPQEVWFATKLYPATLDGFIRAKTRFSEPAVVHILLSAVRGCAALKRQCRRAHGNLKASNILSAGRGRVEASQIAITDPAPGDADSGDSYERADLQAIGGLIYQIVRGKAAESGSDWTPKEVTGEWRTIFGSKAPQWVDLCNRLKDPSLSLASLNLEALEAEISKFQTRPVAAKLKAPLAVAAAVAVLGVIAFLTLKPAPLGELSVESNVPGAVVTITDDRSHSQAQTIPASLPPLSFRLKPGRYHIGVKYTAEYGDLESAETNVVVSLDKPERASLPLSFGGMAIVSDPPGAKLLLGLVGAAPTTNAAAPVTPYTNLYLRPGASYRYRLQLAGRQEKIDTIKIREGETRVSKVSLSAVVAGDHSVTVTVEPPDAIIVSGGETNRGSTVIYGQPGTRQIRLQIEPGAPSITNVAVLADRDSEVKFRLPYAILNISTEPPGADVSAGAYKFPSRTPIRDLPWPVGNFHIDVHRDGYKTNSTLFSLTDGAVEQTNIVLEPDTGVFRLTANLPPEFLSAVSLVIVSNGVPLPALDSFTNRLGLERGVYSIIATLSNAQSGVLEPVALSNLSSLPATTNDIRFNFSFGTVSITSTQTGSAIHGTALDGPVLGIGALRRLQRPNQPETYWITAPHYQPKALNLTVTAGDIARSEASLDPQLYGAAISVDPPDLALVGIDGQPLRDARQNPVPWTGKTNWFVWGTGRIALRLTHPTLPGAESPPIELEESMTNARTFSFRIPYARLRLKTIPRAGLTVTLNQTNRWPSNLEPPPIEPNRAYDLAISRGGKLLTNVVFQSPADGQEAPFKFEFLPPSFTNTLGMTLFYVPNAGCYVGQFEVTKGQYTTPSLGLQLAPRLANGVPIKRPDWETPDFPLVMVSWSEAEGFGKALSSNAQEVRLLQELGLEGWAYALPTDVEWSAYSPAEDFASMTGAVFARSALDDSVVAAKSDLRRVSRNRYELYDLLGNVAEFCQSEDGSRKYVMGGSFAAPRPSPARIKQNATADTVSGRQEETGFRIVLRPPSNRP